MGMFDEVHFAGEVLQTKDFDCDMRAYWIENGRLLKSIGEYVEVPREQRRYPDAPEGSLLSMAGCIRWVESERRDINFHGILHAGGRRFKFTDGQLVGELQGEES